MASRLVLEPLKAGTAELVENKRTSQGTFFHRRNTAAEPRGDFPCSRGAYLNWICCWLKWIGPISQLLITRSWGQMDESSERTLSLILSPLMCCGILGCQRGEKVDGRDRWPFRPSHVCTDISTLSHAGGSSQRPRRLCAVGQTDFTVDQRMKSKTTQRCGPECFLSFTCRPAVGAAGSLSQRSACQT